MHKYLLISNFEPNIYFFYLFLNKNFIGTVGEKTLNAGAYAWMHVLEGERKKSHRSDGQASLAR